MSGLTLNNVDAAVDREIVNLICKAIERLDGPETLTQILASIPKLARPTMKEAHLAINEALRDASVFEFPKYRDEPQYWCHSRAEYARRSLLERVALEPKRKSDLLREVGKRSLLAGMSRAELERIFYAMEHERLLYRWPSYLNAKSSLFAASPTDPSVYVKDALQKLSKKLGVAERELLSSYQPAHEQSVGRPIDVPQNQAVVSHERDERIVEAMKDINPNVMSGDMVSIAELRKRLSVHFSDDEFDRALLDESAAQRLAIHLFDRPFLVSEEERQMLLKDENGNHYNTVSLRRS